MKLSRKVLAGLSAAALLAFAVGCKNDDENEDGVITVESGKASVNYDNTGAKGTDDADTEVNTNPSVRRFATANIGGTTSGNDHYDSICKIDYTGANGSPMGYIFALQGEGSDAKPYSFGIVGVRVKNSKPQYYISFLKGITGSKGTANMIEQANFGVGSSSTTDAEQFAGTDSKFEYEAAKYTDFSDSTILSSDGKLSVVVDVRAFIDGSYAVAFYKDLTSVQADRTADRTNNQTVKDKPFKSHDDAVYTNAIGAKAGTVKIPANVVQSVKHGSDKVYVLDSTNGSYQTALAYYVNVLPTTKVVGTWTVPADEWAVTAQDEAIEE